MAVRLIRIQRGAGRQDFRLDDGGLRTLLDALESIRSTREAGLLFRHSCHHGSCGTCGAMVNGEPRLLCVTALAELPDPVVVEALAKCTRIGDVAVHPGAIFRDIPSDAPYKREGRRPDGTNAGERLEDCIECGLCNAACPVDRSFVGPAALAAIHRTGELDAARVGEMLEVASRTSAVAACVRAFACSRICPMGVEPGRRIQELRAALAGRNPAREGSGS